MSAFIPAFEICLTDVVKRHPDNLQINPGQWVTCDGSKGRVLDPGKMSVLWRFNGESFRDYNLRFKKSLMLMRGINRCRKSLKVISNAKRQISMDLPQNDTPVLNRASESLHRELNQLKQRLTVLTQRKRKIIQVIGVTDKEVVRKSQARLYAATCREIFDTTARIDEVKHVTASY